MSKITLPEKVYNPYIVVVFSVTSSVLIYCLYNFFFPLGNFERGMFLAVVIPAVVSFPISFISLRHHKKIYEQKIELEKLNQLNNKLFSIIGHDIRGPLSVVKGYVEILQDVQKNIFAKEDQKYLINLSKRVDHLLLFLNDLLNWSQNQISDTPIKSILFDTKEVIEACIELFEDVKDSKQITLELQISEITITSDMEAYAFVIRNILFNALKFTSTGGTIKIHTFISNDAFHTIIEDNGIGINTENLEIIKNAKEWFSTKGTNNELGTGFGLKTSIQYLELQKGKLKIESNLNKGTKVTIILPKNGS